MIKFKEYIEKYKDNGLTIFDIDDTLFHTTAKIAVMKDGKKVKEITNQEYNTYKLKAGESYDYSQFRNSKKFFEESQPIEKMFNKAKAILQNVGKKPGSKIVIITARTNFDDKKMVLKTFAKHGLDMSKIRIERAGRIEDVSDVAFKKVIIIRNALRTKEFSRVRLFDDSMSNLKAFLKLKQEFPQVQFQAYLANKDGSVKVVK